MNYHVSLGFDSINSQEAAHSDIPKGYGVDHLRVVEGLGCKAIQVVEPDDIGPALTRAQQLSHEHNVPVVVEVFLEKITNIAMGTEIDNIVEFGDLAESIDDAPTAAALLID
jgi:tartronate-semialdehyde synthase